MIHGYLFYYFLIIRKEASFIGKKFENSTFFVRSIFQDLEFDLGKKKKETKGKFLAQTEQLNPYERFTIKKKKKEQFTFIQENFDSNSNILGSNLAHVNTKVFHPPSVIETRRVSTNVAPPLGRARTAERDRVRSDMKESEKK